MNQQDKDITVVVWPDGTWCWMEDIEEYTHMSDDYRLMFYYDWLPAREEIHGISQQ